MGTRSLGIFLFVICVGVGPRTWADDFNPPLWYGDGNPTNTRQVWEFSTEPDDDNRFAPSESDNDFGTPYAEVGGPSGTWSENVSDLPGDRSGIVQGSGPGDFVEFWIPNDPNPSLYKEVVALVTLLTNNEEFVPQTNVTVTASFGGDGTIEEVSDVIASQDDDWIHYENLWIIDPQPESETYRLELGDEWTGETAVWIDQAVIYTRCVPEPSSWILLSLGMMMVGFVAYRRRLNRST